jgi:hypothetical protein
VGLRKRSAAIGAAAAALAIAGRSSSGSIASGRFGWGFEPWAATARVDPAAGLDGARCADGSRGAGLVLAVRDARTVSALVGEVLAARPDTVVVEMGVPAWTPPAQTAYLATYGASRVCAQAAAEALGLAAH